MDPKKFFKSFTHAWNGICHLLVTEQNARFHLGMTILVGVFAVVLRVNRVEAAVLFFAVVLVFAIEIINTAIEYMLDHLHPNPHFKIGLVKDAMAGAVLISSVIAAVVGLLIFLPHIFSSWFN